MTLAEIRRTGLMLRVWPVLAGAVLTPTAALSLDASQLPPVRGKSIEMPSLLLGGDTICTSASCDASLLSITPPMTGGQPYGLAERARDVVDGMAWIPPALRARVRARTSTTDLSGYLNAALAWGAPVRLPCGTYRIKTMLVVPAGGALDGSSTACVTLQVSYTTVNGTNVPDFKPGSTSVLEVSTNARVRDLQISMAQPDTDQRSALVAYPLALDLKNASAGIIQNVQVGGAINGVACLGNCGGLSLDNVWVGAVGKAFDFDGALNYVFGSKLMSWPIGLQTQKLLKIYNDGQAYCLQMGQVEAYAIEGLSCSATKARFWAGASGTGSFGNIGLLNMDAPGSTLVVEAGQINVGTMYSTKNAAGASFLSTGKAISVSGGRLNIGTIDLDANGTNSVATQFIDAIDVTGGALSISGGSALQRRGEAALINATGGKVTLGALRIGSGNNNGYTRSRGYIVQNGSAQVDIGSAAFDYVANDAGPAVVFNTDTLGNRADPQRIGPWGVSVLGGRTNGRYGPAHYTGRLSGTSEASFNHGFAGSANQRIAVDGYLVAPNSDQSEGSVAVPLSAGSVVWDTSKVYLKNGGQPNAHAKYYYHVTVTPFPK